MKQVILLAIIFALHSTICLAQNNKNKKQIKSTNVKTKIPSISEQAEKEEKESQRIKREASYYAPIRYVIVYNVIFSLNSDERRMEILIDEKQLNEENLIKIFGLIKRRFPLPLRLMINVHTNLATIETPEEREMIHSSNDPRFAHTYFKYKKAFYMRFQNGREAFSYTTNLFPYKEKEVVLKDIKFN